MIRRLSDAWIGRNARPSREALSAVADLQPAVVVTGGSDGIGKALAQRFARSGHRVLLVARREEALRQAQEDIRRATFAAVFTLALDATEISAPDRIEAALAAQGCFLDILVNNAAVGLSGHFESHSPKNVDDLVALNVAALTRLMRHALPAMLARGRGGILNVASLGGYAPGPYQATYYASKAYVISLTEAVGAEVSGRGVRVMVLAPGPVSTGFHVKMGAQDSLYRWLIPGSSPHSVARAGYWGFLLGRRVVVPGLASKLLCLCLRLLPHPVTVPIVAWLLAPRARD